MSAIEGGPSSHTGEPTAAQLLEAGDIMGLMRSSHDRRLEREGIPMILGFVDERGPIPDSGAPDQVAEGKRYAEIFDRYTSALTPWARDEDEGAVIAAMQVLAYTHFAPGAGPITDSAVTAPGSSLI